MSLFHNPADTRDDKEHAPNHLSHAQTADTAR
jgi:hypothetical protein